VSECAPAAHGPTCPDATWGGQPHLQPVGGRLTSSERSDGPRALLDWPAGCERARIMARARSSSARDGVFSSACGPKYPAGPAAHACAVAGPAGGCSYWRPPAQRARVRARRYVHRVGRTARLGREGEALLFLLPSERGYLAHLEAAGHALQELPLLPLLDALPGGPVRPCGALARPPTLRGGAEWHT